jgi:hypothetical protein
MLELAPTHGPIIVIAIKFVENRFIGSSAHLTSRDAAQPNLLYSSTSMLCRGQPTYPADGLFG